MNLGQLLSHTKLELTTLNITGLAADPILTPYINQAYRLFVEQAPVDDKIVIPMTADTYEVSVPSYVSKVKRALLGDEPLTIINPEEAEKFDLKRTGRPSHLVLGVTSDLAEVMGTPTSDADLNLYVLRGVVDELAATSDEPVDVPPAYQYHLVDWVIATIIENQPSDSIRITVLRNKKKMFFDAVAAARADRNTRLSKPSRVVHYGGI